MATFSHSKISAFEDCRLKYKYAYLDRIKVDIEDTVETFLGSLVHEALEKLYRDLKYAKMLSKEELLQYFNREWGKRWKDNIVIVKQEYSSENYRHMGERYLSDYYNRHRPFDRGRVIGLETQNYLSLDAEGKYKYHIRIDRLMDMGNGHYEIHDYKTNNALPPQDYLDRDRQLAMYSLWVRENFKDFKQARLVWHYLAFDKEMESFRSREQLEELRRNVLERIGEIEATGDFPPHVSNLCDWCLYKAICPMWKHEAQLEAQAETDLTQDEGVQLVDDYVRIKEEWDAFKSGAETKLAKLKAALLAYCEKEGIQVVAGTDKKITLGSFEVIKLPAKHSPERQELLQALHDLGRFNDVAELDTHALTRFIQSKTWEDNELECLQKFIKKETGCRLSISQRKKRGST